MIIHISSCLGVADQSASSRLANGHIMPIFLISSVYPRASVSPSARPAALRLRNREKSCKDRHAVEAAHGLTAQWEEYKMKAKPDPGSDYIKKGTALMAVFCALVVGFFGGVALGVYKSIPASPGVPSQQPAPGGRSVRNGGGP